MILNKAVFFDEESKEFKIGRRLTKSGGTWYIQVPTEVALFLCGKVDNVPWMTWEVNGAGQLICTPLPKGAVPLENGTEEPPPMRRGS